MTAAETRELLAALADHDVVEYEGPGGLRIVRRPRTPVAAVEGPYVEPEAVVIPFARHVDRAVESTRLDQLEAELDQLEAGG